MDTCPMCRGQGVPLGTLGALFWMRCQQCGAEFSIHESMSGGLDFDEVFLENEKE